MKYNLTSLALTVSVVAAVSLWMLVWRGMTVAEWLTASLVGLAIGTLLEWLIRRTKPKS